MAAAELVEDQAGLAELADDWRQLAETRGSAFLTPEWFFGALRHAGDQWRPIVAVARGPGESVRGLLPFATRDGRRLVLGGPIRCDALGLVAAEADEDPVAAAIAPMLAERLRRHSVLALGNVDPSAAWWRALAARPRRRLATVAGPEEVLPYIDLRGVSWDSYLASRSRGLRNQLGRKMRNLQRDHQVTIRLTGTADELSDDFSAFLSLHEARWHQRPGASALGDPRLRAFHAEFATAALARGWLRLLVLEVDGRPAGSWYGWRLGSRWAYYQAGFDPQWGRYSVGALVLGETIRRAIEEGAAEYDLLLGKEGFKSRFADHSRSAASVTLMPKRHPARLAAASRSGLRRAWRRLPEATRARATETIPALRRRRA